MDHTLAEIRSPRTVLGVYLAFGVLWILVTDWLVVAMLETPETITTVQTVKGWVFVGLSGLVVFGLTTLRQRDIRRSRERLHRVSQQLQVLQRVFRHNIRNDITVIRGHLDLERSAERGADLDKAAQRTEAVATLSNKMQVVSDVDIVETDHSRVDLVSIATDAITASKREYPDANISLDAPDRAEIYGDEVLRHAISELIENAIKHNPAPPEECEVRVEITTRNKEVTLSVSDNGLAIPDHEIEPLRADEETKLSHTSGVGLWIAKWLCEYCRGSLSFETDDGTTARLTFDVADNPEGITRAVSTL
jgi:signal transduction histidine kinase